MGASQSSQASDFYNPYGGDYAVDTAQVSHIRDELRKMGITGANEEVLSHALAALNSQSKDRMIRDLADDFSRALNLPALSSKGKTTQEILDSFSKNFPGSSKTPGKTFSSNADNQKKILMIMGKLLNKHSGKTIIDLNLDPKQMAQKIGEVLHALGTSVFAEYNTIRNEIKTVLSNIETTEEVMKKFYDEILNIAKSNKDAEAITQKFEEAYKAARKEHDRQTEILKSLLDSESKPNPELEKIIAETGEFKNAIKEIKAEPGTKDFSDTISYAFGLYRTNAQMSKIVEEKLKVLDMTLKQYKELSNLAELRQKVAKNIEESLKDSVAPEKLQEMLDALRALTFAFSERENLTTGADEPDSKTGGLKLDKRVEKSEKLRKALIVAFHSAISHNLEAFTHAGNSIADSADKLPNIPELDTFMKMLDLLPPMDRKIYFSLIGVQPNILATQDRESYISHARALIESIKVLESKKVPCQEHFRDMRLSLEGLIETLNVFSKKFAEGIDFRTEEKVGAWDIGGLIRTVGDKASDLAGKAQEQIEKLPDRIDNAAAQASKIAESVGNAAQNVGQTVATAQEQVTSVAQQLEMQKIGRGEDVVGGFLDNDMAQDLPEINRVMNNFQRTKSVIKYRHRVAMIRENMKNAALEAPHYAEDYEAVTGRSVAKLVDESNKKIKLYGELNQKLTDTVPSADITPDDYSPLGQRFSDAQGIIARYNGLRVAAVTIPAGALVPPVPAVDAEKEFKREIKEMLALLINQENTKVNLYKSAESIDLYLKSFGEHIVKHPEALQDIFNILDSTEISTKWFDSKPGDRLCQVFESFPYGFNQTNNASYDLDTRYTKIGEVGKIANPKYHYYLHVLAVTGLASLNVAGNNYSDIAQYQEVTGAANATIADVLTQLGTDAEAPGLLGPAAVGGVPTKQNLDDRLMAANEFAYVGNPYIFAKLTTDNRKNITKAIDSSLETGILKNIMSMFVSIGNKFGDANLSKMAPISPILVYKHLRNYMLHSAYTLGSSVPALNDNRPTPDTVDLPAPFGEAVPATPLASNTGTNLLLGLGGVKDEQRNVRATGIVMRSVNPAIARMGDDIFGQNAQVTDQIFVSIIKSMIAKVFVTIGTYNMLNRPVSTDGFGYRVPLRLILGAGDSVKVIPEAVELYIRLPLLAEWYRELLRLDQNNTQKFIGMLPEADGTFSNFIDLFFDKLKFVDEGTYSDTDVVNIVSEINKLYAKFGTTRHVIDEFVNEINKRIGVLDKERADKYEEIRKRRNPYNPANSQTYNEAPTDFALSTIDEDDNTDRPTPSALFIKESGYNSKQSKPLDVLRWTEANDIVSRFYDRIDRGFTKVDDVIEIDTTYSFTKLINTKTLEIQNAQSDDEKLRIIKAAITSIGKFTPSGKEASMILFHELVIYPLQQLGLLYDLTEDFKNKIDLMSDACTGPAGFLEGAALKRGIDRYFRESAPGTVLDVNRNFGNVTIGGAGRAPAYRGVRTITAVLRPVGGYNATEFTNFINAFVVSPQNLLEDLIESVYRVCAQGLASYDILSDADDLVLTVNFSKMREVVGLLIGDIKKNIDKFRGVIDQKVIDKYEKSRDSWALYNLENKFYNVRLDGKSDVKATLDYLNQKIKNVTKVLFGEHEGEVVPGTVVPKFRFNMSYLVNKHVVLMSTGGALNAPDKYRNMTINRTNKPILGLRNNATAPGQSMLGGAAIQSHFNYNHRALHIIDKSITTTLVKLLIEYIGVVYDETTAKFYTTTLSNLMNSNFGSTLLSDDGGVNDTAQVNNLDQSADLIPRSLCNILKYSYTHVDVATNAKIYLNSDLSSMPQFYKNRLAALLPVFRSILENIVKKIQLVNNVVKVARFDGGAAANIDVQGLVTTTVTREKISKLFDKELDLCNILLTTIKDTLTELADNGTFFEPSRGFIESYKATTGKTPMMLNSTLSRLYSLANNAGAALVADTFHNVLPAGITSSEFKIVYGARSMNKQDVIPDDFPGLKALIEHHNIRSQGQFHFDTKELSGYLQRSHDLHRHLEHSLVIRNALGATAATTYNTNVNLTAAQNRNITYQWKENRPEAVLRFTEDTDQYNQMKVFIQLMYQDPNMEVVKLDGQRDALRKYNIIDMNIVPINVNALKRELPLINLINYSWTFDKMMEEMLKSNTHTGNLMKKLITNPHGPLSAHEYFDIFPRIVRGNMGVEGLGRPQYLGEEIYNKALFGEVYSNLSDVSPASASAKKEGRTLKQAILEATKYIAYRTILNPPLDGTGGRTGDGHVGLLNKAQVDVEIVKIGQVLDRVPNIQATVDPNPGSAVTYIADAIINVLAAGIVDTYDWNDLYNRVGQPQVNKITPAVALAVARGNVIANLLDDADLAEIRRILDVKFDGQDNSETIALQVEDTISYPYFDKTNKKTELVTLKMRQGTRAILHNAGYLRFETVLVRNIVWLTNIQRLARLALRRELFWHDTNIVSKNAATSSGVTELYGNDLKEIVKPSYDPYVPFKY